MICPLLQELPSPSVLHSILWGSPLSCKIWSLGWACLTESLMCCPLVTWLSAKRQALSLGDSLRLSYLFGGEQKDDAPLGIRALKRRSCRNECNTLWTLVLGPRFPNLDSSQKAEYKMSSGGFGKLLSVNQQLSKEDKWGRSSCITSETASIESRFYFSWTV